MTSLLLGLALTTPGQPPILPSTPLPPRVQRLPQGIPGGPVLPAPQQVLTLAQFSRAFAAIPGKHDVWMIHPRTGQPVLVCFTLPVGGRLERFETGDDWIEFEFNKPDFQVEINFRKNGRVEVEYDD